MSYMNEIHFKHDLECTCGMCDHQKPAKEKAPEPSGAATGSASETPETDAVWDRIRGSAFWDGHPGRLLSERLERERNAWREKAENLQVLAVTSGDSIESLTRDLWTVIEAARRSMPRLHPTIERISATLPQNAKGMARYLAAPNVESSPVIDG